MVSATTPMRLMRSRNCHPSRSSRWPTPLSISAGRFGRVPRAYIETTRDRAVSLDAQRRMQAALPCAPVFTLDADHSAVSVSARGAGADIDLDLNAVGIEHEQLAQVAGRHLRGAVLHAVPVEARDEFVVVVGRKGDVIDAAAAMALARPLLSSRPVSS